MSEKTPRLPFPMGILVLDAIGGVAIALGVLGLMSGGSILPFLEEARVAWSLIAIGAALTLYAGLEITKRARERRARASGWEGARGGR
ncbi:MAG: hypothetical protein N2544_01665 [Burkholderiales bacterium]|nr:hypothetical protein [Burkholderiales bacterium]